MPTPVTTSISTWDSQTKHVQENLKIGRFTNSKQALIAAGPARLLNIGGSPVPTASGTDDVLHMDNSNEAIAFPIGLTNNFSLVSNKSWSQIFEIGSDRGYQIPGHTMHSCQMSRVFYSGPSLLKVLYAYYGKQFNTNSKFTRSEPSVIYQGSELPEIFEAPGYKDLFLNLGSDLFDQLFGLLLVYQDSNMKTIGSIYLEECSISGHSINMDANGTMIVEGCGIRPSRVVPVFCEVEDTEDEHMVWSQDA